MTALQNVSEATSDDAGIYLDWIVSNFFLSLSYWYTCCWHIKDDDVGIVYQDKDTEAAVLVNHDDDDDALILVT